SSARRRFIGRRFVVFLLRLALRPLDLVFVFMVFLCDGWIIRGSCNSVLRKQNTEVRDDFHCDSFIAEGGKSSQRLAPDCPSKRRDGFAYSECDEFVPNEPNEVNKIGNIL